MWLIIQFMFVPAFSPLGIGVIRKIKAKFQNRRGASVFQPYRDLWKLFHKDEVITADASWITMAAPFIIFAVTVTVGASIPLFGLMVTGMASDMLLIVYTLAIGTFFLALAGIDSGGGFGGFSASREMTISALAEGGLIFSLLVVALRTGSTNLFVMANAGASNGSVYFLPIILAFFGFFVVLLAETARFPFDNPATHLELTMIHEAMTLEYSGKRLALIEWAAANKLFIFAALAVNIFVPVGIAKEATFLALSIGVVSILLKMLLIYAAIAVLESTIAKFRFFRLPDLLFISFILSCIGIALLH